MGCGGSSATAAMSTFFAWGSQGKVKIKSMKFKAFYDKETKDVNTESGKNRVTESTLTWLGRDFTLQDEKVIDYDKKISYDLPNLTIKFSTNVKDDFQGIIEPDSLISNIALMQDKGLNQEQKRVLLDKLTKDCRDFWLFARGLWAKESEDLEKSEMKHCDKECIRNVILKEGDRGKIETHLIRNFGAEKFSETSREIKGSAIIQKDNNRPHLVKIRRASYIHAKTEDEVIDHMEEEIRVLIFCWDDIPQLDSDSFLSIEREKMRKGAEAVIKELKAQIDKYHEENA
ncbi:unnamed protein product [Blepharisma stoltei]|uniref:Uncharacterized protein n=1 Tax=Blepharisma stoltei TaxID=1481888 RepID=A0AAU9KCP4_9CILI|nr:unnamed protein product [Blepharisma stoltei]